MVPWVHWPAANTGTGAKAEVVAQKRTKLLQTTELYADASAKVRSRFKNNYFTEKCSGSEAGSYLRLIDFCITQR